MISTARSKTGIQTSKLVKVAISLSINGFVHSRLMKSSKVLSMPEPAGLRKLRTPDR
jgi:hypothetical protein